MVARTLMPSRHKVLTGQTLLASLALLSVSGCVQTDELSLASSTASSEYLGTAFRTNPSITFTGRDGSPLVTMNDEATVEAFQDSSCVIPALGTVSAASNPVQLVAGTASFSNFKYTPTRWEPTEIYLRITVKKQGLIKCLSATSLGFPSFGNGPLSSQTSSRVGFVTGGNPGDAGADGADQMDSITAINIDSNGRYLVSGRSKITATTSAISVRRILPTGQIDENFGTGKDGGTPGLGYTVPSIYMGASGLSSSSMYDMTWGSKVDSQNRIIMIGSTLNAAGGQEFAAWRVKENGSLDTSFANATSQYAGSIHGGTTSAAGGTGANALDEARAMAIDSSGRYVVAGYSRADTASGFTSPNDKVLRMTLWRINSDGSFDSTFPSGAGSVPGAYAGSALAPATSPAGSTYAASGLGLDSVLGMMIDSSGRIVVIGASMRPTPPYAQELAVWRFTANGAPDTTFVDGDDPKVGGGVHWGVNSAAGRTSPADVPYGIAEDSSGRYVIGGYSRNANGGYEIALWRYNSNGSRDTTFPLAGTGAAGTTPTSARLGSLHLGSMNIMGTDDGATLFNRGTAFQIDANGRYVVAGTSKIAACGGGYRMGMWRMNSDGTVDTTFGGAGSGAISNVSGTSTAYGYDGAGGSSNLYGGAGQTCASGKMYDFTWAMTHDSAGRILAAGWSANINGDGTGKGWEWVMWRFKSNGAQDQ